MHHLPKWHEKKTDTKFHTGIVHNSIHHPKSNNNNNKGTNGTPESKTEWMTHTIQNYQILTFLQAGLFNLN